MTGHATNQSPTFHASRNGQYQMKITTYRIQVRNRYPTLFALVPRLGIWMLVGFTASLLWSGGCAREDRSGSQEMLTTVEQVRLSPLKSSAQIQVHLRGVITYLDYTVKQIFLQDSTGGVRIESIGLNPHISPGDSVDLVGTVTAGGANPTVTCIVRGSNRGVDVVGSMLLLIRSRGGARTTDGGGRLHKIRPGRGSLSRLSVGSGKRGKER